MRNAALRNTECGSCLHGQWVHRLGVCKVAYCDCQEFVECSPWIRFSLEDDWMPRHRDVPSRRVRKAEA